MKTKMSVKAAVSKFAIQEVKSIPYLKFSNNDITDELRSNLEFNKHLNMFDRKDDKTNETSKTRWIETWERNVREVFKQTDANIKYMLETHGIVFGNYIHNGKKINSWHYDPKVLKSSKK
ncbi:hypothetical protein OPFAMLBM_00300 [Aeromonas phage avDM12-TAAL]|nr:hypothetical protein OPFAMLBM_00300 [Aeromonas phage avDM12-TAAL]